MRDPGGNLRASIKKFLWKNLRYIILIVAVAAAIVTPTPDAKTMLLFTAPMIGLYLVGISVAGLVRRKKPKRAAIAVTVREMRPSDVAALSGILKESPEASTWPEESLIESALSGSAWVAEENGDVIGFLIGRGVADEFEILNLAVARAHRRRGVATRLLETMFAWMRTVETRRAYLEVRASNDAAITLYAQHGFKSCGQRKGYYQNPVEDAVTLCWDKDRGI